ncbi:DUF916 domain-containing protein [Cellulosimicrobium sp. CUA-896]|uniref:DUF916 domain-containing protein n=1 Tax=Cellulosimicrobium sp. CUA-896 TaxID=1517881 RepID=UPI000967D819|nr:DUF916 domain-containing protein [Cellulosimicrobium sp. CUA-896]OLT54347.1 hypothetical protein BJF88_09395 [Cellulosimicrobium sp. CUA-896]
MTSARQPRRTARRVLATLAALSAALLPAASAGAAGPVPAATATVLPAAAATVLPADTEPADTESADTEPADSEGRITWSVTPSGPDGPDGRRWVDLELDPGASVDDHLAVTNFGDVAATFAINAADGYLTANGRFNMLPSTEESTDAGTWIDVQDTVEVGPEETVVVPYTLTVPENATPGDHPAGIAASVTSTRSGEGGTNLGVESRVGFRITTRVTGEVQPALAVPDVSAAYTASWNPFAAGELRVSYDVANEGNIRLGAASDVSTSALFGLLTQDRTAQPIDELLPDGSLNRTVEVDRVWPLGPVTTTVTVTPSAVGEDVIDASLEPVTVSVTAWAIPWPQLLLVAIVVVVFLGVRDDRRRRRKRLEDMLAKARDEGRRSADAPSSAPAGAGKGEPSA